jgi:hypothetical protein
MQPARLIGYGIHEGFQGDYMHSIRTELNRAVFSRGFLAAAIGTALALCVGAYDDLKQLFALAHRLPAGIHAQALLSALTSEAMLTALPVLAALPGTAGFVEDWRSGYLIFRMPRGGVRSYISSKAWAAALSGALAVAAGIAAAYCLFLLAFLPAEAPPAPDAGAQGVAMELLGKASMATLCAALWSLVGLACSTATLSAHMAYAAPFILYYLMVIFPSQYFPGACILSPQEWLKPAHAWPGGSWGLALLVAELTGAAAMGFAAAARRRLAHG